ncbi:hypothetical protein U3516DRAFT_765171 [Neocallimastix sp. 'constans']
MKHFSKFRKVAQNKGLVESGGDGELDIGMKLLIGGAKTTLEEELVSKSYNQPPSQKFHTQPQQGKHGQSGKSHNGNEGGPGGFDGVAW